MQTISQALDQLQNSAVRARFHLTAHDVRYVQDKGMDTIRRHAEDFVAARLAPAYIPNDGRQTPMRGHPVFIAQHACACCCRKCLQKWYHVPQNIALNAQMQRQIVDLLMAWIDRQVRAQAAQK